jgi:hypothetical protein
MIGYRVPADPRQDIVPVEAIPPESQKARLSLFLGNTLATRLGPETLTDFGHSIKTLWMINLIAKLAKDDPRSARLLKITSERARGLLAEAWNKDSRNTWCDGYKPTWNMTVDGSREADPYKRYDCNKTWWMHDELDQASLHLALEDFNNPQLTPQDRDQKVGEFVDRVTKSFTFYRKYLVDPVHHGVFHQYNTENFTEKQPPCGPNLPEAEVPGPGPSIPQCNPYYSKAHHWKNAYHESEHAIVGYVVTENLRKHKVTMFYAYNDPRPGAYPYAYFFKAKGRTSVAPDVNGITRVVFEDGVE